jgi:predicted NBD/HSP70 family sugar kinase
MKTDKYQIRDKNKAELLNQIIKNKEISRADLAKISKLNKASVSSITRDLIDDSMISEVGTRDTSELGGRKPTMLKLNSHTGLVIAIDLGFDYLDAMISYLDGTEITRIQLKKININKSNVVAKINRVLSKLIHLAPDTIHGVIGLTIAVQGQVSDNQITFSPVYDIDQIDLIKELSNTHTFPIYIENEANLSALGEYAFSSNATNLISVSLHSGIGAGIVKNGLIEHGTNGNASNIGHMILFPNGRPCPCGNRGCLNQYVSTKIIYEEITTATGVFPMDSDKLADLYQSNPQVQKMVEEYSEFLAVGINNIIMMYAPQLVILNSRLTKKIPSMLTFIHKFINNRFSRNTEIINSPIKWNPVIYGAIAFTIQQFMHIDELKLNN